MIDTEKLRARIKSHGAVDWQTSHQLLDCFDEIDRLRGESNALNHICNKHETSISLLQEKLRTAVAALELIYSPPDCLPCDVGIIDRECTCGDFGAIKLASEAIKEIEGNNV